MFGMEIMYEKNILEKKYDFILFKFKNEIKLSSFNPY
jgi:hypothetical protein